MTCNDYDRLSLSDDTAERQELIRHAESCPGCAARLQFEERLTEATRSLRQLAPDGVLDQVLAEYRASRTTDEQTGPRRLRILPAAVAVAATITVAVLGFLWSGGPDTATGDALLSNADLRRLRQAESAVRQQHTVLVRALPPSTPLASPSHEEARHLDAAIGELRQAIEFNQKNRHLRERLIELERRRNTLLAAITEEQAG